MKSELLSSFFNNLEVVAYLVIVALVIVQAIAEIDVLDEFEVQAIC